MNWRKIDDVEGLKSDTDLLCTGISPFNPKYWMFECGYFENNTIYTYDDANAKRHGFTHYCIITPPEE